MYMWNKPHGSVYRSVWRVREVSWGTEQSFGITDAVDGRAAGSGSCVWPNSSPSSLLRVAPSHVASVYPTQSRCLCLCVTAASTTCAPRGQTFPCLPGDKKKKWTELKPCCGVLIAGVKQEHAASSVSHRGIMRGLCCWMLQCLWIHYAECSCSVHMRILNVSADNTFRKYDEDFVKKQKNKQTRKQIQVFLFSGN